MFDNGQSLVAAASRNAAAVALVDGDTVYTYGELLDLALRLAAGFERLGIVRGDRLLVMMQNRAEMALAYWATQLAGIVFTPINWRTKVQEIDYFLGDSGAKAVLFDESTRAAVQGCTSAAGIVRIDCAGEAAGAVPLRDILACEGRLAGPRASADDLSVLLYTSGTTGPGKGVPRTHHAERAAAIAHVAQNAYLSGEVTLGVMPLYHTMGVRLLLAMAQISGSFISQHRFDPAVSLELIDRHAMTALYLVPTLYHDLLVHPDFATTDVSSVRKLGFAGAPMSDGLLRRVDAAFRPHIFVNHYGSSEIYTFTVNQQAAVKPGSAGRAGVNSQIRVIPLGSSDVDAQAVAGSSGQIITKMASDEAFAGYWHRPDADARAIVDGWYLTGDVGHIDEAGDLFVTGRVDDMIISGGENILPAEIESLLSLHPAVADVVVAGRPDNRLGQCVAAFVIRAAPVTEAELDAWCQASHMADFKRPRRYEFVDTLPRSPVGKVLRRLLPASVRSGESNPRADARVLPALQAEPSENGGGTCVIP